MRRKAIAQFAVPLAIAVIPALADIISLAGALDPQDPNDVLLIAFSLSGGANVNMQSYGFGGSVKPPGGTNANGPDAVNHCRIPG